MALVEISNLFLLAAIVCYVLFRLFCELKPTTHLRPRRPSDIQFTTASITNDIATPTGEQTSLKSLIDDLVLYGDPLALNIEPIRIIYDTVDHTWRSLDNRRCGEERTYDIFLRCDSCRLYALRKAEERGSIASVRYTVMRLDEPAVLEEYMAKKGTGRVTNANPHVKVLHRFPWDTSYNLR